MTDFTDEFIKLLLNNITDLVFVMTYTHDEQFVYEYINPAGLNIIKNKTDIIGKTIDKVTDKKTAKLLKKKYKKSVHARKTITFNNSFTLDDGERRYSQNILTPLINRNNECTHVIAIVKDITYQVKMKEQLKEKEEHFRIIAEQVTDLITLIDFKGDMLYLSPSYKAILGKNRIETIHPEDQHIVFTAMENALKNKTTLNVEYRQFSKNNEQIWFEARGTPVFDDDAIFKHMVVVTRDISEKKLQQSELEYEALHDELTGLPNRRFFTKLFSNEINYSNKPAVILLDLDYFKKINDQYGHDIGDAVLIEFGKRLLQSVNSMYTVARLGGDEFVIIFPTVQSMNELTDTAEKIKKHINKPWQINNYEFNLTSSMGIAIATATSDANTILKHADIALYKAKNSGRNTYKIYE